MSRMFNLWGWPEIEIGVAFSPFGLDAVVGPKVQEITMARGTWRTSRGIHLGSTRTALQRTYGKALRAVRYRGAKFQARTHYYIESGPNALAFVMSR